ncbi:protein phosphatase 2C domain-containing protein [Verrucomicrobia bacterium]|nr:protein phosphatase 2C domain-containing protein [Verrucomicrobiota bacterium]MDB4664865.1 protein phosphatase 2C domain-containing protein [Verrucomicrobiota bacterium]
MSSHIPPPSIQKLSWTAQTSPGRYRSKNEDSFLLLTFDMRELCYLGTEGQAQLKDRHFIFAVSDGIGGAKAGQYASQSTLKPISDLISRTFHQGKRDLNMDPIKLLGSFCEEIHRTLVRVSGNYQECNDMGATLSIGWVFDEHLYFAHLGDSRIFHIPDKGVMLQLTDDHTMAARRVREGSLSPQEAKHHAAQHILERSIGGDQGFDQPQLGKIPLSKGDKLIFATDGVTECLTAHTVARLILTPPSYLQGLNPAQRLVKEAFDASGKDNITAIIVDISP